MRRPVRLSMSEECLTDLCRALARLELLGLPPARHVHFVKCSIFAGWLHGLGDRVWALFNSSNQRSNDDVHDDEQPFPPFLTPRQPPTPTPLRWRGWIHSGLQSFAQRHPVFCGTRPDRDAPCDWLQTASFCPPWTGLPWPCACLLLSFLPAAGCVEAQGPPSCTAPIITRWKERVRMAQAIPRRSIRYFHHRHTGLRDTNTTAKQGLHAARKHDAYQRPTRPTPGGKKKKRAFCLGQQQSWSSTSSTEARCRTNGVLVEPSYFDLPFGHASQLWNWRYEPFSGAKPRPSCLPLNSSSAASEICCALMIAHTSPCNF